jgi:ParB family chromosome partitioning protein
MGQVMSRKDILGIPQPASALPPADRPAKTKNRPMMGFEPAPETAANRLTRQASNALHDTNVRIERANEIERRLAKGLAVVEMDTTLIDPSFVQDRMEGDIEGLLESIREQGQQVPVLLRPHPDGNGRYQVAFGHRRLRAVSELGRPVKAIVREMSDEELVIAQGQENNEREDLTFIEKARFASKLNGRFPREVIAASMSMDRTLLSRMLVLVDALPEKLVDAIGRAPGVGRPSWQQMAEFIEKASDPNGVIEYAISRDVQALPSEERFKRILAMKSKKPSRSLPEVMSSSAGTRLAQVTQNKIKLDISIDKRATPEFAAFVLEHLPTLFEEHQAKLKPKTGD